MRAVIDHLAVSAETLEAGVAYVESVIGIPLAPGGRHRRMGTHNRLLSLGPDCYLEVIARDPEGYNPPYARWFDLDRFAGRPRLTNWVARTEDIAATLAHAPSSAGQPVKLKRGDLKWAISVPEDGRLPFDGTFPAFIEWHGGLHPGGQLPESGCRLIDIEILHPEAAKLTKILTELCDMSKVQVTAAEQVAIRARLRTHRGIVVLQ